MGTCLALPLGFCTGKPNGDYRVGACDQDFITCLEGETLIRRCSDGFVFDPKTRACEHPTWVESCPSTSTQTTPRSTTRPTPPAPPLCKHGDIIQKGFCSEEYTQCQNGVQLQKWCQVGEVLNTVTFSCMPKEFVPGCFTPTVTAPVSHIKSI